METRAKRKITDHLAYWGILFFIVAQVLTLTIVSRSTGFLEAHEIYIPPQSSPESFSFWPELPPATPTPGAPAPAPFWTALGPILIYFFSVVIVLGIVLFLVPIGLLRHILKAIFAALFSWGVFIALAFWIPVTIAVIIALVVGLSWFLAPRVWLHNLVLIIAMVSVGAVFGRMISPWTAMLLLSVLAVYDFFAVRFGYMVWLAEKLSESNTLPAFYIPRLMSEWKANLKENAVARMIKEKSGEKSLSILGGGDIAFPVILVSSVYFAYGLNNAVLVAAFSLFGLIGAYCIQAVFLKGKPTPALPSIAILSLIAVLIVKQMS